jgi:hypothetical protein
VYTVLKVVFRKNKDGAPANVRLSDGTCFVDPDFWHTASDDEKRIVLYHEEGHYLLNTRSEYYADNYALNRYFQEGGRPKKAVLAVVSTLPLDNTERQLRALNVLNLSKEHNEKLKAMEFTNAYAGEYDDIVSFLGLGKKGKENRQQKKDLKLDRRAAKNERIRSNAESRLLLAEQGINTSFGQQMKDSLTSLADVAGKFIPGMPSAGGVSGEGEKTALPGISVPASGGGVAGTGSSSGTKPKADDDKDDDDKILGMSKGAFFAIVGVVLVVVIVIVISKRKK